MKFFTFCTSTTNYEETNERIFFQLSNYPPVLEQVLRVFMTPPSSNPSAAVFSSRFFRVSILQVSWFSLLQFWKFRRGILCSRWFQKWARIMKTLKTPNRNSVPTQNQRSESTTTAKPTTIHHRKCLNCFALQRQCGAVDQWNRVPLQCLWRQIQGRKLQLGRNNSRKHENCTGIRGIYATQICVDWDINNFK